MDLVLAGLYTRNVLWKIVSENAHTSSEVAELARRVGQEGSVAAVYSS